MQLFVRFLSVNTNVILYLYFHCVCVKFTGKEECWTHTRRENLQPGSNS